jgi:hypothetical protein
MRCQLGLDLLQLGRAIGVGGWRDVGQPPAGVGRAAGVGILARIARAPRSAMTRLWTGWRRGSRPGSRAHQYGEGADDTGAGQTGAPRIRCESWAELRPSSGIAYRHANRRSTLDWELTIGCVKYFGRRSRMERAKRFELSTPTLARLCSTTELRPPIREIYSRSHSPEILEEWSGRRDSNSRPQPWQGCALPLSYARIGEAQKSASATRRRLMAEGFALGKRPLRGCGERLFSEA